MRPLERARPKWMRASIVGPSGRYDALKYKDRIR